MNELPNSSGHHLHPTTQLQQDTPLLPDIHPAGNCEAVRCWVVAGILNVWSLVWWSLDTTLPGQWNWIVQTVENIQGHRIAQLQITVPLAKSNWAGVTNASSGKRHRIHGTIATDQTWTTTTCHLGSVPTNNLHDLSERHGPTFTQSKKAKEMD